MDITIAVHGASGFTGGLVLRELARRGMTAVLVGRDEARLRAAAERAGLDGADLRTAGTGAFAGCDAVVNCAGPFSGGVGEAVVREAMAARCHYLDVSGEQRYLHGLFGLSEEVEKTGVTVVPGVNDDGLPSDLLARLVAPGPVDELVVAVDIAGSGATPSKGTLRSALATMADFTGGGLAYEDGVWSEGPTAPRTFRFQGDDAPAPVVPFPLPAVVFAPRHLAVRRVRGVVRAELAAGFTAATPELIEAVPVGPDEDARARSRWTVVVEADGVRGVAEGPDTYGTTAVIAVEAAARVVTGGARPGVLTPAQAYDPAGFLDAVGVRWSAGRESAGQEIV